MRLLTAARSLKMINFVFLKKWLQNYSSNMFSRIVVTWFEVVIYNECKVIIPWSVFFSSFLCDHEKEIAIAIYSARARGILNNYCGFCLQTNWNEIFSLPIITSLCWSFVARIFFSNYRMKKMSYFVGKWSSALINNWSEVH